MPDLACCHQPKQRPCRLRGRAGRAFETAIVEPIAPRVLAPAAVLVLNGQQPIRRFANHWIAMVDTCSIEGAQRRPGTVDVIQPPAAVPRSLRELRAAKIPDPVRK